MKYQVAGEYTQRDTVRIAHTNERIDLEIITYDFDIVVDCASVLEVHQATRRLISKTYGVPYANVEIIAVVPRDESEAQS